MSPRAAGILALAAIAGLSLVACEERTTEEGPLRFYGDCADPSPRCTPPDPVEIASTERPCSEIAVKEGDGCVGQGARCVLELGVRNRDNTGCASSARFLTCLPGPPECR